MRKFKLLALAFVIGTSSLFATTVDNPDVPKKEIRNQIINLLGTPDFIVSNEINVIISFTFSSEGEIVVLNVDSKNSDVLNFVRENLNYKKISNPGERDKLYTMPLKVKAA